MPSFYNKHRISIAVLLLFVPAVLIRFVLPLHFPLIFWDEGLWNLGAKHDVLVGDPFLYGWSHAFLSPLHHFTTLLLYSLFSPGLMISRWLSGFFGVGIVAFTYLFGKRYFDRPTGFIAAILVGYNSLMILSSRQAMLEQEVTFYMLAAAYFWFHSRPMLIQISGLFLAAALLVKAYALSLIPALIIGQILFVYPGSSNLKRGLKRVTANQWLGIFLGIAIALITYCLMFINHADLFLKSWLGHTIRRQDLLFMGESLDKLWDPRSVFRFLKEFTLHCPDLLLLASFGAVFAIKNKMTRAYFLVGWIIFSFLLISLQVYRPARYYYPIIPGLALLSSIAWVYFLSSNAKRTAIQNGIIILIVLFCSLQIVRLLPYYREGTHTNKSMIQASTWLNNNLKPGEAVLSMYQTALLIDNPIIPAPPFLNERWRASNDPEIVPELPGARYCLWTSIKAPGMNPSKLWTQEFIFNNFVIVKRYGKIVTIYKVKNSPSDLEADHITVKQLSLQKTSP